MLYIKKLFALLLILVSVISCSGDSEEIIEEEVIINKKDDTTPELADDSQNDEGGEDEGETERVEVEVDLPQTWKLYKMTCAGAETCNSEGEEMPFKDTYTFNEEKTVLKLRIKGNDTLRIQGDFKVYETEINTHEFSIEYEGDYQVEDIDLISGCFGRSENLYLIEEDEEILKNNVSQCGGPDLYYKKD